MFNKVIAFFTLFSSLSTLICCALPALLVTLGLGASLASFLGNYPQLIWLSEHKIFVFAFAGIMLLLTGAIRRHGVSQSCPIEPGLAAACKQTRSISTAIFYGSLGIYLIGAFFAFVAPLFG